MVSELGHEIRHHEHYAPAGTNVNFVQLNGDGSIRVRTFERGVGETLACGTGVSAAGLITAKLHGCGSPVREEQAHIRCPQCGVIEACCEGICAQPASLLQPYSQCP